MIFAFITPLEWLRAHALALPTLAKFGLGMAILVGVPPLSRRLHFPAVVVLLLSGVLLGPYCLDVFGKNRPVASFLADLGKLLLMFFAGLEIDLAQFMKRRNRALVFGLLTTFLPLLLGTLAGLWFGYLAIPAIVLGSLLASHTLLGFPIVAKLGVTRLEAIIITAGATILSDTLSLIVFAICVPVFKSGFSVSGLLVQLLEIAIFFPVILIGVSRGGAYFLKKVENEEDAYFVLMLAILAISALLADIINLPGIVGAFLAGLAVNAAVRESPAKEKLEFFGNSFFYSHLLYNDWVSDQPSRISPHHNRQSSAGPVRSRSPAGRKVVGGSDCRTPVCIHASCTLDDVGAHVATGCRDAGCDAGRV